MPVCTMGLALTLPLDLSQFLGRIHFFFGKKMDEISKIEDCSELSECLALIFSGIEVLMSTIEWPNMSPKLLLSSRSGTYSILPTAEALLRKWLRSLSSEPRFFSMGSYVFWNFDLKSCMGGSIFLKIFPALHAGSYFTFLLYKNYAV